MDCDLFIGLVNSYPNEKHLKLLNSYNKTIQNYACYLTFTVFYNMFGTNTFFHLNGFGREIHKVPKFFEFATQFPVFS